tara:strand:+ start:265 stop:558 length:294 start_codon:yes stop_codon:yes gene_type:complete
VHVIIRWGGGWESLIWDGSLRWFHGGHTPKNMRIFEMQKPFLMHRDTAMSYLDMDEFTFELFIIPSVTRLRFGSQVYFLTEQLEMAVLSLIDSAEDV